MKSWWDWAVMKIVRFRRLLIICLLCVSCFGLVLLKLSKTSQPPISPVDRLRPRREDVISQAFALDDKISATHIDKSNSQHVPLIGKSLSSFLLDARGDEPQSERRTVTTDMEDYEVEVKKQYTFFYHSPAVFPDSRQEQVDSIRQALREELPIVRKRELRRQLRNLLKDAQFAPVMHRVVLYPLGNPRYTPKYHD